MVSFTHEQNIIGSQTQLDEIAHEQSIICRQLFAGHVVCSWPMKRKKNMNQMIIYVIVFGVCDGVIHCRYLRAHFYLSRK